MLECHVSTQDFVAAVGFLTDTQLMRVLFRIACMLS